MSEIPDEIVSVEVSEGVATVRLNRPRQRNALSSAMTETLPVVVSTVAASPDVRVVVVTGTDPAFCAGLDLKELGSTGENLGLPVDPPFPWPWDVGGKPVIGAINGPAVAGGLELALHCDILIASEHARFADTHARIGQLPGAGLTVRLPRLIGPARARQMSLTGNFIDARTALAWGLVSDVVPHGDLSGAAHRIAQDIAANDQEAVLALNRLYAATEDLSFRAALAHEARTTVDWQSTHHEPALVESRRGDILARAHDQLQGLGR